MEIDLAVYRVTYCECDTDVSRSFVQRHASGAFARSLRRARNVTPPPKLMRGEFAEITPAGKNHLHAHC